LYSGTAFTTTEKFQSKDGKLKDFITTNVMSGGERKDNPQQKQNHKTKAKFSY
jgi:hypothetical protein